MKNDIALVKSTIEADCGDKLLSIESIRYENNASFSGIVAEYRRKGFAENPPVRVKYYMIHNDDEMVTFILSYREEEEAIWGDDFEKVIASFRWNEKKIVKKNSEDVSDLEKNEVPILVKTNNGALKGFFCFSFLFFLLLFLFKKQMKK